MIDAVRTPMGSYRGALSGVRPDDLAAHTVARSGRAHRRRPGADRRRLPRRRQPVGRGQPRRRPDGGAARRPPPQRPRRHRQPPLRLGPGGRQLRRPGGQARRGGLLPGRRGRVDEPRALGRRQARARPAARAADDARHDPRLALRQPADGRGRRLDRVDGRDRRERRRALQDQPRGPGRLRPPQPPARRRRRRARQSSPRRSSRSRRRAAARPSPSRPTRARAPTPRWRRWRSCVRPSARAAR